jgi:dihydroorotate dehydrogenase electron transfer subunit
MIIKKISTIVSNEPLSDEIYRLTISAPEISNQAKPGQFINIKVSDSFEPFLRRPFSICNIVDDKIQIIFNTVGKGTKLLSNLKPGDKIDILGPLGKSFNVDEEFNLAIILAGGLGVAPFPFLTKILKEKRKDIISFIGARTKSQLILDGLENVYVATDDGSYGYKGTVIDLLKLNLSKFDPPYKIFACGPTPMLKALVKLCDELNLNCEVSVETPMACGTGICQGCAVKTRESKYKLACKDGPVFNIKEIIL